MVSVFDGNTGILASVFGGTLTWTPSGGSATDLVAVFRARPVRLPTEDGGEILDVAPTVQIRRPDADSVARGDTIAPGDGNTYRVLNSLPSGSPAPDAFVMFQLELIP